MFREDVCYLSLPKAVDQIGTCRHGQIALPPNVNSAGSVEKYGVKYIFPGLYYFSSATCMNECNVDSVEFEYKRDLFSVYRIQ